MDVRRATAKASDTAVTLRTFLIADIRGYTAFTREHGDQAAARLAKAFADLARDAVEARSGTVIELRGDEALAVFPSSSQAIRAAVELQAACHEETAADPTLPLPVGIGIDAGDAVPVEGGFRGVALNMAARLCSKATAGEVLVTRTAADLAADVSGVRFEERGTAELKGFDQPVELLQAVWLDGQRPAVSAAPPEVATEPVLEPLPSELDPITPMVDRDHEMHWLRGTWRQARRGKGRLVLVSGPAGIGKTRLIAELAGWVHERAGTVRYAGAGGAGTALAITAVREVAEATDPTLLVVNDLEALGDAVIETLDVAAASIADRPVMIVGAFRNAQGLPALASIVESADERGDGHRSLPPLDVTGVTDIVRVYAGREVEDAPVESMWRASGGVPSRVHEVVSEWARDEAKRRLTAAAEWLAAGRSNRAGELEFANNVIALKLGRLYDVDDAAPMSEVCPYRGLAAFDIDDAANFFGRERLVGELAARTVGVGLLGVVGPSGSGKSSAVLAGLIPSLTAGLLPGSERWHHAVMRPGEHPIQELRSALGSAGFTTNGDLVAAMGQVEAGGRLVLLVDQFEELFTATVDADERNAFVEALVRAAREDHERVIVVLTVRADFYGHCADYPELARLLAANHVLVGTMGAEELHRAVELPARRVGLRVESALSQALVSEVTDEPGGLPLLSTTLFELWGKREGGWLRMRSYEETGGLRGAVARLAERSYQQLTDAEGQTAKTVLLRLVGSGEGEAAVRRRVPITEFNPDRNAAVATVLDRLTQDRLLTRNDGLVEIAHEALIREWPRLRDWLEEDVQGRAVRGHLTEAAKQWQEADRNPAELYRGPRLSVTMDWAATHSDALNELERAFLSESRQASERDVERQRRTNRRLRGLLAGVAVFLVLALLAGGLALVQRGRARESAAKAEREATAAEAGRLGAQAVVEDELDTSLLLARQAFAIDDSIDTRGTLLASLLKAPGAIRVLPGTGSRVFQIRASADGSTFVTADNVGDMAVYDAESLDLERIVEFNSQPNFFPSLIDFDLSPDGTLAIRAASLGEREVLVFVNTEDGSFRTQPLPEGATFAAPVSIAFHPGGDFFVSAESRQGRDAPMLVRRDPTSGRALAIEPLPIRNIDAAAFSPDGERLLVRTADPVAIAVLDAETLEVVRTTRGVQPVAQTLNLLPLTFDMSPDGRTLAIGREDGTVKFVDVVRGRSTVAEGRHTAAVQGVGFSPDGSTLVTTGDDRDVLVWDVRSRSLREILHGHAGRALGPVFNGDGSTAFTVGLDGRVIAWDLTGRHRIGRTFTFTSLNLYAEGFFQTFLAAVSPDGSLMAVSTGDSQVATVDVGSGNLAWEADPWSERQLQRLRESDPDHSRSIGDAITALAFSPDGRMLAVSGQNQEVVEFDTATGEELSRWEASQIASVQHLAFAPDGSLVTANDDGGVAVWEPRTGHLIRAFQIVPRANDAGSVSRGVARVVPSPDGSRLAVLTYSTGVPRLFVIDAASGRQLWGGKEPDRWNAAVGWSPDSKTVATGGWQSGDLILWDASTGRPIGEPTRASAGFVIDIDFAWDGRLIVTGATDGTVRLFNARTLKQVGSNLPGADNEWTYARVLPDDQMLAITQTGRAWRWELDPERWAEQACTVANRTLTESEWRAFLPNRPYHPACVG